MLQYLEFMDKVHKMNENLDLSHYEVRLLELIAKAQHQDQTLFIGDLIGHRQIASQATLHGVVKGLIRKKLISAKIHKSDGRNKIVSLTASSLKRFEELQRSMGQAVTS